MQRARYGVPAGILVSFLLATVALANITAGSSATAFSTNVAYSEIKVDIPLGAAQGDALLANITFVGGNGSSITAPDGWTFIERTNKGNDISLASYWKSTGNSEPEEFIWKISPPTRAIGGITRLSGVDTTNPIGVVSESSGRGVTATAPSITTTMEDSQLVALFSIDAGLFSGGKFSVPSGMSEKYDISYAPLGPSTALDTVTKSTTGSSGSKSSTFSKSIKHNWAAQLIALNPKASISIPEPIAYWKFDESSGDAIDASGHGKTLTNHNSTPFVESKVSNGADFERDSSNYFSRTNDGFDNPSGTVSCWIKYESNPSVLSIASTAVNSGVQGFDFRIKEGDLLHGSFGAGPISVIGNTSLSAGTFYLATFTWNTNRKELFLNGVSDGADETDATMISGHAALKLGTREDLIENFDGIIDECGIWDTVLTDEQIESLYNSGAGRSYPF